MSTNQRVKKVVAIQIEWYNALRIRCEPAEALCQFLPFGFFSYMQYFSTATTEIYATKITPTIIDSISRGLYNGLLATSLEIVDRLAVRDLLDTTSVTTASTVVVFDTSDVALGMALVFISASNLILKIWGYNRVYHWNYV